MEKETKLSKFNTIKLNRLKNLIGPFNYFWDELEDVLKYKNNNWKKLKNDIVVSEVWEQYIGQVFYKHTVHKFSYLYIENPGLAIKMHGHKEPANYGKQIRKIKEWYIFPDGTVEFCGKDEEHQLFNKFDHPIYVLSIKVSKKGNW